MVPAASTAAAAARAGCAAQPDRPPTEGCNPRTAEIDRLTPREVVRLLLAEDASVPAVVAAAEGAIEQAVALAVAALRSGGRVHYAGAGTSGRLGVLDAVELPATYGIAPDRIVAHLAGGGVAMFDGAIDVEDDEACGARDLAGVAAGDLVVGLTASGGTPYVVGALRQGRAAGAATVLVSCHPAAPLRHDADVHVCVPTGPEPITGSTRMRAATAQKLVLQTLSTATMVALGLTSSHHMVGVVVTNAKLHARAVALLRAATGVDEDTSVAALADAGGDVRAALVVLLAGGTPATAQEALRAAEGSVRGALDLLSAGSAG